MMIYPSYLTVEAIRKPKLAQLKHCCIIWTMWYWMMWGSMIIDNFLWWFPFISLFDTLRLIVLILVLKEEMAENMRSLVIQPMWLRVKKGLPKYYERVMMVGERYVPKFGLYKTQVEDLVRLVSRIVYPSVNVVKTELNLSPKETKN